MRYVQGSAVLTLAESGTPSARTTTAERAAGRAERT